MKRILLQRISWTGVVLGLAAAAAAGAGAESPVPPPSTGKAAQLAWAFQPIKPSEPPADPSGWSVNPIDRFIRAKLREHRLEPADPADPRTLLRRVTFDLTGLPPTPEEVDIFLADQSPVSYERLVDRLLASPHYGEHWGRHWLDVARYADTGGFETDVGGDREFADRLLA
jgi:hypothetical protein